MEESEVRDSNSNAVPCVENKHLPNEKWKGGGAETLLKMENNASVSVKYHSNFGSHDDLLLLEVDDKLLSEFFNNRVIIRGQPDDEAVLCTPSTTYALKFVGTSNSVFLVPAGEHKYLGNGGASNNEIVEAMSVASVLKVASGVMELVPIAPKLDKLKFLLEERLYTLEEDDEMDMELDSHDKGLYSFQDLRDLIQASDNELMSGLESLSALEINGFWRILDKSVTNDVLTMILRNAIIHEWQISALKEYEVLPMLETDGYPVKIVTHCLNTHGKKSESSENGFLWSLDEKKLCLHFAKQTLTSKKMKLENFMTKWKSNIPTEMNPDLAILEGEVLYEKIGMETWIRGFSVSSLPSSPQQRFSALFKERPKWKWKDLHPFIRDLKVPGVSSDGLLIKYTRRTQPTGDSEPVFSAR